MMKKNNSFEILNALKQLKEQKQSYVYLMKIEQTYLDENKTKIEVFNRELFTVDIDKYLLDYDIAYVDNKKNVFHVFNKSKITAYNRITDNLNDNDIMQIVNENKEPLKFLENSIIKKINKFEDKFNLADFNVMYDAHTNQIYIIVETDKTRCRSIILEKFKLNLLNILKFL